MSATNVISLSAITNTKSPNLTLHLFNENKLLKLPVEILYIIMDSLGVYDLRRLSWTCRFLCHVTRHHFGMMFPVWEPAEIPNIDQVPTSCYRDGVWLEHTFYLPIFYKENPTCWMLDLTVNPIKWAQKPLKVRLNRKYEPIRHYASAAINNLIYIFGGENIDKGVTTNAFYELNVCTFELRSLNEFNEKIPSPRMMHTLDPIDNHRLAMFGGRSTFIHDNKRFAFDSKDFAIYNTRTKTWTCYNETPNTPYRRSLHNSFVMNGKLHIYGGQQFKHFSNSLQQIHDDEDISIFDFHQEKWSKLLTPSKTLSETLLPSDWMLTTSTNQKSIPGKRMCAGIFTIHNRIAIFGGSKKENWNNEEANRPWELICFLSNVKRNWEHMRIRNLPQLEILTVYWEGLNVLGGLFLIGKDKNEGNLIMGWVKDSTFTCIL